MARNFAGHSVLGSELNKASSQQDATNVSRVTYKTGIIKDFAVIVDGKRVAGENPKADGLYEFTVQLSDGTKTTFLPYVGTVNENSEKMGHPSAYLGQSCYIMYEGVSSNNGKIISLVDDQMDPATVGAANQLQIAGAAFAPPGGGMV